MQIRLNRPQEAIEAIVSSHGNNPTIGELNAALGTAYFVKGDWDIARSYLETAKKQGIEADQIEEMLQVIEGK